MKKKLFNEKCLLKIFLLGTAKYHIPSRSIQKRSNHFFLHQRRSSSGSRVLKYNVSIFFWIIDPKFLNIPPWILCRIDKVVNYNLFQTAIEIEWLQQESFENPCTHEEISGVSTGRRLVLTKLFFKTKHIASRFSFDPIRNIANSLRREELKSSASNYCDNRFFYLFILAVFRFFKKNLYIF